MLLRFFQKHGMQLRRILELYAQDIRDDQINETGPRTLDGFRAVTRRCSSDTLTPCRGIAGAGDPDQNDPPICH